ncbi:MAG: glycine C-acetyltransferase [bacterium]|nr:glycine C-acetyltransferase [bacterium]
MSKKITEDLRKTLEELKVQGLYKNERIIATPQGVSIRTSKGKKVLNFCSNNYLGLANDKRLIEAAYKAMKKWGYGLASVPFICGIQKIHKELEKNVSEFLGTEDTILYACCFDSNAGVFEPLLGQEDAIISDEIIHASIIDGVRLCKAQRWIYKHSDIRDTLEIDPVLPALNKITGKGLERCLKEAQNCRYRIIATDGVFSMDGDIAKLDKICDLADRYDALVMVDDSHATGYIGKTGRGTHEHCNVMGRVDIITTTFGKALGGALGGCASGRKEIIEIYRQRSRTRLFSNSLAPAIVGAALKVLKILSKSSKLHDKVMENAVYFREEMINAGFDIIPGKTAIVPVMLYSEPLAVRMADMLLKEGIYVIGFTYPVVPKNKARIRVQLSAAHSIDDLNKAIRAFVKVGKELGVTK